MRTMYVPGSVIHVHSSYITWTSSHGAQIVLKREIIVDYIIHHASGKTLSKEEKREVQHYAQKLKYPKGALVFNGSGEEDFLYCLLDNKEISVSQ